MCNGLISKRVLKPGNRTYEAVEMTTEEILERRMDMRKLLKDTSFHTCTDDDLDNMRISLIGEGFFVEDVNGYEFFQAKRGISKGDVDFRRVRSMMPFEFLNLMGSDFKWDKYQADIEQEKSTVNKYILRFQAFLEKGMGLYICSGTKGSGKTMLACCILNELTKRYICSVKFVNALDFLEMTKKGYRGEENEVQALYYAKVLVIDDIGVQMSREWIETEFYRLVNDRYSNRKPTIYTSNIPIDRLKMDERITDRIESTTYVINLPEESIRRKERQQEKARLLHEIENAPV